MRLLMPGPKNCVAGPSSNSALSCNLVINDASREANVMPRGKLQNRTFCFIALFLRHVVWFATSVEFKLRTRGITVALCRTGPIASPRQWCRSNPNFLDLFDSCWCVLHWNDHRAENQELHCVALCRVRLVTQEQVHPRIFERTI